MTTDEAGLLIATLAAAYPRQALEPATIEIYTRSLADLDNALATNAVARIIASSTFFPTIAEIRTEAAETACQLPTATEAWLLILDAMHPRNAAEHNSGVRWAKVPAEGREALKLIGGSWAIQTSENPETLRAQFRRAYDEIRQRSLGEVLYAGVPALTPAPPLELTDGDKQWGLLPLDEPKPERNTAAR